MQTFPTVDHLLREMDRQQVDVAVLQGWYWEKPETCVWQNRFFAECRKAHPDRLAAFATLHPAAGQAAVQDEIRWTRDAGFCGLGELSPHSQHCRIDDPVLAVALELAGESGLPVNLHVTDPTGRNYPGRVDTPLEDFRRLARAFPGTTFILSHWGGGLALLEANPDIRDDLANVVTTLPPRRSSATNGSGAECLMWCLWERCCLAATIPWCFIQRLKAGPAGTGFSRRSTGRV